MSKVLCTLQTRDHTTRHLHTLGIERRSMEQAKSEMVLKED